MIATASPAPRCRRRRLAVLALLCCRPFVAGATPATPAAACTKPGTGWCIARRFPGTIAGGEFGFRFGEPLDLDGDGRADVAAGARFTLQQGVLQNGTVLALSGADGHVLRRWDGEFADGLFGQWVMPIPDISGDGLADLVVAAPHAPVGGRMRGVVVARSPKSDAEIWRHAETESENLGWDLTLAGDQNGDGHPDLFVGAPGSDDGRVYLLNGVDGTVLRTYTTPQPQGSLGWYVASIGDLDGDGRPDLLAGAPYARNAGGTVASAVWLLSSATGTPIHHWTDAEPRGGFGSVLTAIGDLDGDGKDDVVVGSPATEDPARSLPGEVRIYSGATGAELRRFTGSQPGELFGRMLVDAGDVDGDGTHDLVIGAPWYRRGAADKVGRVEVRSGKSGALLAELVGETADDWFGWHIRRAPDPDGRGRPTLLIAALRRPVGGALRVGELDLYVLRRAPAPRRQGTTTRGARRIDAK